MLTCFSLIFQRVSNEKMLAEEESDTGERIEVFIKFNTPLSPIPEESSECNSCQYTPRRYLLFVID